MPKKYGRFIEPFFGGGALFFAVQPSGGVIADSNPELINVYRTLADDVDGVIAHLARHKNTESAFFTKSARWIGPALTPTEAAARTVYLNRTCFNGLLSGQPARSIQRAFWALYEP